MQHVIKIYLVTYGPFSKCIFLPITEVQAFIKSLPESERRCALVTATDMTMDELEYRERSQAIVDKLEADITEVKMNVADRFKSRKPA